MSSLFADPSDENVLPDPRFRGEQEPWNDADRLPRWPTSVPIAAPRRLSRIAPHLLALAIIGAGVGGAIRIVRAQDTAPPAVSPAQDVVAPKPPIAPPAPANGADTLGSRTLQPGARAGQDPRIDLPALRRDTADTALQAELRALTGERDRLNARIATLRAGLAGGADTLSPVQKESRMTPEQRRQVAAALAQARQALQQARKALEAARTTLPNDLRGLLDSTEGSDLFQITPEMFDFSWQGDGDKAWKSGDWKQFQKQMQSWKAVKPDFEKQMKAWKAMQPEFEKQMKAWGEQFRRDWDKQKPAFEKQMREMRDQLRQSLPDVDTDSDLEDAPEPPSVEPAKPSTPRTGSLRRANRDSAAPSVSTVTSGSADDAL